MQLFFLWLLFFKNEVDIQVNILSLLYLSLAFLLKNLHVLTFSISFSLKNCCASKTALLTLMIMYFSLTQYCLLSPTNIVMIHVLAVLDP